MGQRREEALELSASVSGYLVGPCSGMASVEQGMGGHTKIRMHIRHLKGADHHKLDLKSQVQGRGWHDRYQFGRH